MRAIEPLSSFTGRTGMDLAVEMAHDLRSPMTSILALAELLQSGQSGPVNDAQRRQLGVIYMASLHLCTTASDVMELARGGDTIAEEARSPFSISEEVSAVEDMVRPMLVVKGLTLHTDLPEADRRLGWPKALSRVLLNLATNAIKFTDEGFVAISARGSGPDRVEFSVRDTGLGMDPETLRNLYEPFGRTSAINGHHFTSCGLGLAITRKLVVAMDSEIEVESEPGWGTRFSFDLQLPLAS